MRDLLRSLALGTNVSAVLIAIATFAILYLLGIENWLGLSFSVIAFNALLNEEATKESNKFFSSIDPKIRKFSLFGKPVFLLDTVGFISNMSNDITDAFNSTFSEIAASDLILHIIDSTEKGWEERKKFVDELLISNGCDKHSIIPLFSKKSRIKIKHPLKNGFFYDAFDAEDITKIKKFIFEKLSTEE